MSVAELFDVNEADSVWDAWLATINLLDMLEFNHEITGLLDFGEARRKISKILLIAETHRIDRADSVCHCGLSQAEHAILKRKILTFFKLQISSLKHFID